MKKECFLGTEKLEKGINTKLDTNEQKINWLHIRQITLEKENPYCISMKTDFDSESVYVDIERKSRANMEPFWAVLVELWPRGKPLADTKLQDIHSYMHPKPVDSKPFNQNFTASSGISEDIDGFNNDFDSVADTEKL
ncbi:hypothetical protein JTB14_034860 [Gonioctena quinquepunctata]|nr:hypothetical protein JTB14_034860 [Gonioctena quinquepunctata]